MPGILRIAGHRDKAHGFGGRRDHTGRGRHGRDRPNHAHFAESWGYHALEAHTPTEALDLFEAHGGEIHLLLTDIQMPQMTGPQLADELRRRKPDLRIVFMSGYPDPELAAVNETLLAKPFNPTGLSQTVRRALDSYRR